MTVAAAARAADWARAPTAEGPSAAPAAPEGTPRHGARTWAAAFEALGEQRRSGRDCFCAVAFVLLHSRLMWALPEPAPLAGLILRLLLAISLATLLFQAPPLKPLYVKWRWVTAAILRLGMPIGAMTLQRAWPLGLQPANKLLMAAASLLTLLLSTRSLLLSGTAYIRRLSPVAHVSVLAAALPLAGRQGPPPCLPPCLQDSCGRCGRVCGGQVAVLVFNPMPALRPQ